MSYVMGVDGGTESLRAFVFDLEGHPKGLGEAGYITRFPKASWAEQDPMDWWDAFGTATRLAIQNAGISPNEIKAIGLDTTSCSVVALNHRMESLRPALIWMDVRAGDEAQEVSATKDSALKINSAGDGPVSAEWMIPKALWLKRHEAEIYTRASAICEFQDYLNYRLTSKYVGSFNNFSIRWHFVKSNGGLPASLLSILDLTDLIQKWPSTIVRPGGIVGELTSEAAQHLGLPAGLPVVQGGADAFIGMIGLGVMKPGQIALITGSSHLQLAVTSRPVFRRGLWGAYEDCVYEGSSVLEGGQTSTGSVIKWFTTNFCGGHSYAELDRAASQIEPGADGLVVLDHFQGNRTPYTDPRSRGAFTGLTLAHTPAHLFRAIIESTCFGTEAILRAFQSGDFRVSEMVVSGGATKSTFWLQTHADVSGVPLILTEVPDGPALGSAVLAAVGADLFGSIEDSVKAMVRTRARIEPNQRDHERYRELFDRYTRLYGAMKSLRSPTA